MTEEKKILKQNSEEDNIIFIGTKPFMNYVNGVVMQFTAKQKQEVKVED